MKAKTAAAKIIPVPEYNGLPHAGKIRGLEYKLIQAKDFAVIEKQLNELAAQGWQFTAMDTQYLRLIIMQRPKWIDDPEAEAVK